MRTAEEWFAEINNHVEVSAYGLCESALDVIKIIQQEAREQGLEDAAKILDLHTRSEVAIIHAQKIRALKVKHD